MTPRFADSSQGGICGTERRGWDAPGHLAGDDEQLTDLPVPPCLNEPREEEWFSAGWTGEASWRPVSVVIASGGPGAAGGGCHASPCWPCPGGSAAARRTHP